MANALKGEALLGDLTLCYNFGAFCELETRTGMKMRGLMELAEEGLGFNDLIDFVWAGLQKHHAAQSSDAEIKALIDEAGYQTTVDAVAQGMKSYFGEDRKPKDENPPKAKRSGTG